MDAQHIEEDARADRLPDGPLSILPVHTKADLRRFLGVTREVYKLDPLWVQPLTFERLDHLNPKKNPFLRGIEIAYWTVARGTTPIGRISAQINRAHIERYGDETGHFGFFECLDDPVAARLLLETAEIWLRERGMVRVMGPFSPSINDELGLLVEGYHRPPAMMMPHGRPYYDRLLQGLGYAKAKDLIAYEVDVQAPLPPHAARMVERLRAVDGLVVRHLDMRRYQDEIATIVDIFNDAWSDNWGFISFGSDEARYLAHAIRPLVKSENFAIAELHGEPVAMTVTLPDLNEAIEGLDGRILPFGWLTLLRRLKIGGVERARMPLMGVRRRFHHARLGAALALGVIDKVKTAGAARGVTRTELSWILEDNHAMRRMIESMGGVADKTYRLYAKTIA